jgi:hypothetical protein
MGSFRKQVPTTPQLAIRNNEPLPSPYFNNTIRRVSITDPAVSR